jgi:hypothetical protein
MHFHIIIDSLDVEVDRTEVDHGKGPITDFRSAARVASNHLRSTTVEDHNLCNTCTGGQKQRPDGGLCDFQIKAMGDSEVTFL